MMDESYQFDKSLQERLDDYLELFGEKKVRSCAEIKREWSFYLELAMDSCGWQALWKIPRITCEELKISYPSIVLVYIAQVDFSDLTAEVQVLALKEDIAINEKHHVPLMQLWPTKQQDYSTALNVDVTANALDMYRFFYTNICFPWDSDDDVEENWLEKNLETRLRLFYDLKNGVIPRFMAEHIRTLLNTSQKIQARCELIEDDLLENQVDEENTSDERVQSLMELNVNMIEIKNEIKLLENPLTRNIILKRRIPERQETKTKQFWLIVDDGKLDDYFAFLNQVKVHYPEQHFKISNNLQSTLEAISPTDTIILWKKLYAIQSSSGLECGGTIKGLYDKEATILSSRNDNIMLDLQGPNVLIENVTLNATNSQCGILVRAGKTTLKNCLLVGDTNSSTHQGIIVLKGAQLELIDCEITGFYTALVGNSGSQISLQNCNISESCFGTKIYDLCNFKATNCKFQKCREYAFCVETDTGHNGSEAKSSGDFKLLEIMPDIKCDQIVGENNQKGDVLINPVLKFFPKNDLFSDAKFDPTSSRNKSFCEIMEDQMFSDEEMELHEGNVTIIENSAAGDV